MCGDHARESGIGRAIAEYVNQAVRASFDRVTSAFERGDVNDGQFTALVRGRDDCRHSLFADGRDIEAVRLAVVVYDLDVIASFIDAGIDEGLRLAGGGDRRDLQPILGTVSARGGDQRPGRKQVRAVRSLALRLLLPQLNRRPVIAEHIEFGGYSEHDRLFERGAESVRVGIDQTRQESMTRPVDYLRPVGRGDRFSDRLDLGALDDHGAGRDDGRAVENADIINDDGAARLPRRHEW